MSELTGIPTIAFKDNIYPAFQAEGYAAKFAIPFALEVIKPQGKTGYDIGCNRKEWALPGAMMIDPAVDGCNYHAMLLPEIKVDYIFSSHCLEHLQDWVRALDYWTTKLHEGGILFLYLPHPDQEYWLPWNNTKHIHILYPQMIAKYLRDKGFKNVMCSERDLNHSFIVIAER